MHRDLAEVLASQRKMLAQRGEPESLADEAGTRQLYAGHLAQVDRFLSGRRCFRTMPIRYADAIGDPAAMAAQVAEFLDRPLDRAAMAQGRGRRALPQSNVTGSDPSGTGLNTRMRRMSTRVLLLLAVLAAAGAAFWLRPSPSVAAAPTELPLLQWVATAHQLGIVGYRDPAVGVSPGGRLVAYSEGRALRVVPIGGGVAVASALGDGQIRHLTWIDDRRVIFEDGGAPARWQLLDLGDRRPSAVAVVHADRDRRDQRHDAASQRAPAGRGEPRRRVDRRPGRRQRRAGAVARAARRTGAVEDRDHDRPGGVAGVDVAPGDRLRPHRQPRAAASRFPAAARR